MNALFDTNIVIDALNGVGDVDTEYKRYGRVFISVITWMEVMVGAQANETELQDFMETHFETLSLDAAVADRTVHLRRTYHLRLPDAIIWATAQVHDAQLITRNTKDFRADWDGIRVPYQV